MSIIILFYEADGYWPPASLRQPLRVNITASLHYHAALLKQGGVTVKTLSAVAGQERTAQEDGITVCACPSAVGQSGR